MRNSTSHILWDSDAKLFESMKGNYQSANEKKFFEYLFEVEQWDFSMSGDLLLHEDDNEDKIYIMRIDFDEYEVGKDSPDVIENQHVQGLADALALNMKKCGFLDENISLMQWLKKRDYKGVRYDQNRDFQ